jgi:hypothetical protein
LSANSGTALGYGANEWTARLRQGFAELFHADACCGSNLPVRKGRLWGMICRSCWLGEWP